MFVPEKSRKTVRILVRIKNGQVFRFDSTSLPKISDGTLGDLILPASTLIDDKERQELQAESLLELLPAGTYVLVGLNPHSITQKNRSRLISASVLKIDPDPQAATTPADVPQAPSTLIGRGYERFADVRLLEPLKLHLRGDKEPSLEDCKCSIPALATSARSLNHAYTLLSTAFEAQRISHSGNVFTHVFFRGKTRWISLNEARGRLI
jgi:hypothetical protein